MSILDTIRNLCTKVTEPIMHSILCSFILNGIRAFKKVEVLSYDEQNNIDIITVLLQHAHLLQLDEPTNHLNIASKKVLLRALQQFASTINESNGHYFPFCNYTCLTQCFGTTAPTYPDNHTKFDKLQLL